MIRASRLKGVLPVCNATLVLREFRSVFRHLVSFYIHHMDIGKNLQRRRHQIVRTTFISRSGGGHFLKGTGNPRLSGARRFSASRFIVAK